MRGVLAAALALALATCGEPYHRKDGAWWFQSERMDVPKGESLTALKRQLARSKTVAFYQHRQAPGADPTSFQILETATAADKAATYQDLRRTPKPR